MPGNDEAHKISDRNSAAYKRTPITGEHDTSHSAIARHSTDGAVLQMPRKKNERLLALAARVSYSIAPTAPAREGRATLDIVANGRGDMADRED